jgi:hypothetical protein
MRQPVVVIRAICLAGLAAIACGCEPPPDTARLEPPADGAAPDGSADATAGALPDAGSGAGEPYSFVVLPDTQYYSSSWPDIFTSQTRWVVDNRQAQKIAFVLHTGDIVDSDVPAQWMPASQSLQLLDGQIPYAITAGNHDYFNLADRMGLVNSYFPPSHFAADPWFGGTYEDGHVENNFSLFPAGAGRWLVIALEFGPRDEVLAWADSVLKIYRDVPAIIITHAYLYHDSTRYDFSGAHGAQNFNPHSYIISGQPGTSVNDGEQIWQKLIAPNGNVKLVFSGHDVSQNSLPPGTTGRLTSTRSDGSMVHQILANYQTCLGPPCETFDDGSGAPAATVRGGNGYLRILRFSPADQTIAVTTYSPYVDQYLTDDGNQFTLPMN